MNKHNALKPLKLNALSKYTYMCTCYVPMFNYMFMLALPARDVPEHVELYLNCLFIYLHSSNERYILQTTYLENEYSSGLASREKASSNTIALLYKGIHRAPNALPHF